MADQTQRLEVATVRAEVGSSILYRFSNDAVDAAVIPTESGNITNLKKVILDIQTEGAEKISFATTIYPTTAAGIADTTNGAIFLVASSDADEIYAVYSNSAGTAVDTGKRAISGAAVTAAVNTATTAATAAQTAADTATARVAGFHSPSATDPVTRDDGTALQIGDTYFNTASQSSRIYTNTGWAAQALDAAYLSANQGASRVGTAAGVTVEAALAAKEPSIAAGTALQYWRGDKTFQALNRSAVGLANVDNTADASKPVSSAQLAALNLKVSYVDSVAMLRASADISSIVGTSGYYTRGDGGASFYYYDSADPSSVDNGGSVIVRSDGRRYKMISNGSASLKQFGAKGDGVTDDTARIQAAVDSGILAIYVPPVQIGYRTTAPIIIKKGVTIRGEGVIPFAEGGPYSSKGAGSWFFLDHLGRGFVAQTSVSNTFIATIYYDKIGTYRNHVNPVVDGWTPTTFDFDFAAYNADVFYTNLMLLNPYRGIFHTNGNGGRVTIDQVRGQFIYQGIYIETTQDTTRIENFHDWPFWLADANVTGWSTANKNLLSLGRCDNPLLSNIFSIYTGNGIYIFNYTGDAYNSGSVSKLKAVNLDFDQTWNWLTIDTGADNVTAQFTNASIFGPAPNANSHGSLIKGNYARLDFVNYMAEAVANEGMYIQGTGNVVKVVNARGKNYSRIVSTTPLFFCGPGNVLEIANKIHIEGLGTVLFDGGGAISYPQGITRGTANLPVGAVNVTVNHNLPLTPSTEQILLSLGGPAGAAKSVYVSAVTATTFTISAEAAASVAVPIHWRAAIE